MATTTKMNYRIEITSFSKFGIWNSMEDKYKNAKAYLKRLLDQMDYDYEMSPVVFRKDRMKITLKIKVYAVNKAQRNQLEYYLSKESELLEIPFYRVFTTIFFN